MDLFTAHVINLNNNLQEMTLCVLVGVLCYFSFLLFVKLLLCLSDCYSEYMRALCIILFIFPISVCPPLLLGCLSS